MNCITYLDELAQRFCATIAGQPRAQPVATKDYGWANHRWTSVQFRMAHVEIFNRDRFMVLHCCVFPHYSDYSPIFGFDAIAGESKVTGLFWDLSPTVRATQPFNSIQGLVNRARPEWGDIFSEHWVACRPTPEQLVEIGDAAVQCLGDYLPTLAQLRHVQEPIIAAQDRYCLQQRKNEHTIKAIENLLGPELANEFVTTVLFPTTAETVMGAAG
jgi:phycocyanobilin:ferredoxin oxidoreductase